VAKYLLVIESHGISDEVLNHPKKDCSEGKFQFAWELDKQMDIEHAVKFAIET